MEMSTVREEGAAEEGRWGARALDYHWVVHSIVHHAPLPKEDYLIVPYTDSLFVAQHDEDDDSGS